MSVKHLTSQDFDSTINSDKPVLVDFWATWCGPCRMLGPTIDALANEVGDSALVCKLDVDQSPEIAEMEKILENTYRNINIGLINEMAMLCERMKINIWEVIDAARTKPYGFQAFYPGPGLGGHCIPLDPYYLSWKVREYAFHTSMIEASMMINDRMPEYCSQRIANILNDYSKSLKGSRILVLGIAYKADIDDCRESPAIRVINVLRKKGAEVLFYDPLVKEYKDKKGGNVYSGVPSLTADLLGSCDIVVITTAHSCVDYNYVQNHSRVIFDTRNAMKDVHDRSNIVLL